MHTVIRSSGTTGVPKPVELTFANHVASALASADALGVGAGRPLAHARCRSITWAASAC